MISFARSAAAGLLLLSFMPAPHHASITNSFALPASLDQMLKDDAFRNYVNGMDWGGSMDWRLVKRKCRHPSWCKIDFGASSEANIKAVSEVKDFDVNNKTYTFGVVVGKTNVDKSGAHKEGRYGLPANGQTAYFVVMPSTVLDHGTWLLIRDKLTSYDTLAQGTFVKCKDDPHGHHNQSFAGFVAGCGKGNHALINAAIARRDSIRAGMHPNDAAAAGALADAEAAILKILKSYDDLIGPAWFSCIDGCCIADS